LQGTGNKLSSARSASWAEIGCGVVLNKISFLSKSRIFYLKKYLKIKLKINKIKK